MPQHVNMGLWSEISFFAFILIEISYLPQIFRLYRMKEAHEFHILYPLLNLMGRILGLVAGIMMHQQNVSAGFAVGIVVRLTLLGQVFYYRERERRLERLRFQQVSV